MKFTHKEVKELQEKYLPFQLQPIRIPYAIVNYHNLNQPLTKADIDGWWANPEGYFVDGKAQKGVVDSFTLKCGQICTLQWGAYRLAAIDLDENDHPLRTWLRNYLPEMGVWQRFAATGKVRASVLSGKKGAKGETYFVLVPKDMRFYSDKLKSCGTIKDEKGKFANNSGDLLLIKNHRVGPEPESLTGQDCFTHGAHKSYSKTGIKYEHIDTPLCDVDPHNLPIMNRAWATKMFTENERLMDERHAERVGKPKPAEAETQQEGGKKKKKEVRALEADRKRLNHFGWDLNYALQTILEMRSGSGSSSGDFEQGLFPSQATSEDDKEGKLSHIPTIVGYHCNDESKPFDIPFPNEVADYYGDHHLSSKARVAMSLDKKGAGGGDAKRGSYKEVHKSREQFLKMIEGTERQRNWGANNQNPNKKGQEDKRPMAQKVMEAFLEKYASGDINNCLLGNAATIHIFNQETKQWNTFSHQHLLALMLKAFGPTAPSNLKSAVELLSISAYILDNSVKYRVAKADQRWQEYSAFSCANGIFRWNQQKRVFDFVEKAKVNRDDLVLCHFPYNYEPDDEKVPQCPRWDKHIDFLFDGDQDDIRLFFEHLSLGLTTYRGFRCALFLHGATSTGKSVMARAMQRFFNAGDRFGEKSVCSSVDPLDFGDPNRVVAMSGRRLNINAEGGSGNPKRDALTNFKRIMGGDPTPTKTLYVNAESEVIDALQISISNQMWKVLADDRDAMSNRMLVLKTTDRSIDQRPAFNTDGTQINIDDSAPIRDLELDQKLSTSEEFEGLFNKMVRHLNAIMKRGGYIFSEKHLESIQGAMAEHDLITTFLERGPYVLICENDDPNKNKKISKYGTSMEDFVEKCVQWLGLRGNMLHTTMRHKNAQGISDEYAQWKKLKQNAHIPASVKSTSKDPITGRRSKKLPFRLDENKWKELKVELSGFVYQGGQGQGHDDRPPLTAEEQAQLDADAEKAGIL